MRLPGVCIVCRRSIWWSGKTWRQGSTRGKGTRHACPPERPKCGAWMPNAKERCARGPGHTREHRTQYAMDNQYHRNVGRERAA